MNHVSVLQCLVSVVSCLPAIPGITSAWRVEDDRLSPAVSRGDVVCCTDPSGHSEHNRALSVIRAIDGTGRLVHPTNLTAATVPALPVRYIIKR